MQHKSLKLSTTQAPAFSQGFARGNYLPNFCNGEMVFAVVLIAALLAIIFSTVVQAYGRDFWLTLASSSMFLLWLGLIMSALLCGLKKIMKQRSNVVVTSSLALCIMLLSIMLVSWIAIKMGDWYLIDSYGAGSLQLISRPFDFVLRNVLAGGLISAMMLRYFFITHQFKLKLESEAQARIQALQARIRPHFLFNSMNTIALLTRKDPKKAESAVEDLADLFRASLSDSKQKVSLAEEIDMAKTYVRIEQERLGERLHVDWQLDHLPMHTKVPGIILQPLLENAIYHGIESMPDGGTVTVNGKLDDDCVQINIVNPVSRDIGLQRRQGNHMALANIKERLALAFGARASFATEENEQQFKVTLAFPMAETFE